SGWGEDDYSGPSLSIVAEFAQGRKDCPRLSQLDRDDEKGQQTACEPYPWDHFEKRSVSSLARNLPPALKYVTTAWDIVLITLLLMLTRDPKTMLAVLYFLVVAAAGLRFSLPLVYVATLGTMAAYLYFLGYVRFWLQLAVEQRLSRPQQIV